MKFICQSVDLSDAVLKVVRACATKTTQPVLECIKFSAKNDSVTLTATDGEISIVKVIHADICEEGEICVPGRTFAEFLKKLESDEITLTTQDNCMVINYDDNETAISILSAKEFPLVDINIHESSFVIQTSLFKTLISSTTFCCATDESRPLLKGCQFIVKGNHLEACALDGFRLATFECELESATNDMDIIIASHTLSEIEKMLPAEDGTTEIFVQKGLLLVSVDSTILTSRLFKGDFIKKENVIPKTFTTVVRADKNTLRASVERAAILVRNDKNNIIVFDVTPGKIEIKSMSEVGNLLEPIKAEVEGKDVRIAMNSKFITEAVSAITDDTVEMSFNSAIQPFICQNAVDKRALYLILPIRTVNNV